MTIPNDWEDLPKGARGKLIERDREILKQVKLISFTADPATIQPFEESRLSWEVEGPKQEFTLKLNSLPVTLKGSKMVKRLSTTSYKLTAYGVILSKQLDQLVLKIDDSQCKTAEYPATLIIGNVTEAIRERFHDNDQIRLKNDSPKVTMDQDGIHVGINSTINVPDWFDADMDIGMDFRLVAELNGDVSVFLSNTNVDVSWSLLEHLASLGCTGVVQSALERLMKTCIDDLLKPYLESDFAKQLQGHVDDMMNVWKSEDPEHRRFQLYKISTDPNQMTIVGCPLDAAQSQVLVATSTLPIAENVIA